MSITVLWLVLISRPTEGRRLSWPGWLSGGDGDVAADADRRTMTATSSEKSDSDS